MNFDEWWLDHGFSMLYRPITYRDVSKRTWDEARKGMVPVERLQEVLDSWLSLGELDGLKGDIKDLIKEHSA